MTKKAAIAGILIALLVGVAWLWKVLSVRPTEPTSTSTTSGTPAASEKPATRASGVELWTEPVQRAPAAVDSPKDSPGFAIEGSVVVLDPSGGEHPNEDGFFSVRMEGSGDDTWKRVDVAHGRWTVRTVEGAKLRIGHIELGGHGTFPDPPLEPLDVPPDHRFLLHAKWTPSILLHVRATDTGQELAGVELVRGMAVDSEGASRPGPYATRDVLAASGTSPFHLDELDKVTLGVGAQPYFARADKYAWGRIEIDLSLGADLELLLPPGGSLAVDLTGAMPPPDVAALLVRPTNSPRSEHESARSLDGHASFLLESVAAGHHFVSVELRGLDPPDSVLGSGEVDIPAGSTAHLSLALREIPRTDKAPLEGIVIVPKDWRIDEFRLMALRIGRSAAIPGDEVPPLESKSMRSLEGQPDARAFSWPAVPVGSYALVVLPPGWATTVEVGPHGVKDARVDVPPPALVSVRVVDAALAVDAPIRELQWSPLRPKGDSNVYTWAAQRNSSTSRFEFSAPIGDVEITVADPVYLPFSKRVSVGPGRNELTIEVDQACGVLLEVRQGNVAVPFDDSNVSIEQVGGDGRSNWNTKEAGTQGMKLAVTNPGRYRVQVGGLSGYRQVGKVLLDIEPGKFAEVVVQVEREP